ncbi:hypothetical protein VSX64_11875 [Aurantimonas sp. C2-6-R+9]|uniref:hypothetical protein n=1 Tax=unclassified Aurantimonas TaxID=2638230 RepID=UPI002E18A91C|nr:MULTISPECIES: hypothetical protein [unclassified Aurantimonas]MEC5291368.1 hypothetical protein [Aurantimonas sp. C2-3-R2]MEC5381574.1 hypothetical protein [Aurantimonas sp. C2-6-R+9]MEC5412456.1 hypothetical protein [Aurantimonas sp. C2-4-R8]
MLGYPAAPQTMSWLNGVVPAWAMLDFDDFNRLRRDPPDDGFALTISSTISSPVATTAMRFLQLLGDGGKLTATGNLARAFVSSFIDRIVWPNFYPEEAYRLHRVINEQDCLPLHAVRIFCDRAGLIRRYKGELRLTKVGKRFVKADDIGELNRALFLAAGWNTNLSYFDCHQLSPWPQSDIGLALWCLSVVDHTWQTPESLARSSTVPINGIIEATSLFDLAGSIFEARILRILTWFGLLDVERIPHPESKYLMDRRYRKTAQFDEFLSFDVAFDVADERAH